MSCAIWLVLQWLFVVFEIVTFSRFSKFLEEHVDTFG